MTVAMEAGGGFGRTARADGAAASPKDAGAIGLIKSLSREWDGCSAKVVDLDPAEAPEARAAHLIHETSFVEGRREVGYPGGRRTILRTEPASLAPPHDVETMIDADWVVLATGGARGITAECLRSLAPYRPTLVLVGRSPRPGPEPEALCSADAAGLRKHYVDAAREAGQAVRPAEVEARVARHLAERDMRRNLADFEEMGATVDYRSVDVGDPAATEALLSDLYETYGRIDLVVHGAGVIEDKLLEQKSPESFARVYDTKVDSAFCLLRGLRPEGLKGICFFTSVAGRYGNRGQTDYAAANEMLNGLAWRLRRDWPQVRVKAINWGPWGKTSTGAGMVTEDVRKQFEARGVGMVEPLPGRDLFFKEMFWSDPDEVEVVGWVADGETLEAAACELPATDGPQPLRGAHVLLRDALKRENGYRKLIWPYDLVTAPYADHHRFDGKAVLPAASLVQMMSEVPAAFGIASPVVGIADFKVLNGIALADAAVPLQFVLESDGRTVTVRPETDDRKAHYRGTLVFESAPPAPAPFARDAAAEDGLPDAASLYRDLFSHGPRFQTMTRLLSLGPDVVRAELRPTAPGDFVTAASGAAWSFDPGLLDGVLQMTWIWTTAYQGGVMLPAGIGAV
ncbi:MAG: SDR family NAD(P)-dependent oxidoreductase, partial [Pseudomonadota bacterium]